MSQPFLSVNAVSKRFGDVTALSHVSLEVHPNELVVVLGPTGAGKTTLLRTICGLETPDSGQVVAGGRDVTHLSPAERDFAIVFQNFSLYPRWSVRKNMEFPLRAPGRVLPEVEIKRRVEWAAEILRITRLLERQSTRLSGGEMQRVAIGRAIVRQPQVYLMDEPLTNLDAKLRESLRVELVELRRRVERPMVFVTHDQAEALSMADRIVVLSEGRVLQVGTPEQVYDAPASPTVALQLGQPKINLVRASLIEGNWVAQDGTQVLAAMPGHPSFRDAILGVRPERIALKGGTSVGRVKVVEYMGPTTTLLVEWASQHIHISVEGVSHLRPGDAVAPLVDASRVLVWAAG
jgi:multiple sugar transport system ATP-binding protein